MCDKGFRLRFVLVGLLCLIVGPPKPPKPPSPSQVQTQMADYVVMDEAGFPVRAA